jgi:hypothetical protein
VQIELISLLLCYMAVCGVFHSQIQGPITVQLLTSVFLESTYFFPCSERTSVFPLNNLVLVAYIFYIYKYKYMLLKLTRCPYFLGEYLLNFIVQRNITFTNSIQNFIQYCWFQLNFICEQNYWGSPVWISM